LGFGSGAQKRVTFLGTTPKNSAVLPRPLRRGAECEGGSRQKAPRFSGRFVTSRLLQITYDCIFGQFFLNQTQFSGIMGISSSASGPSALDLCRRLVLLPKLTPPTFSRKARFDSSRIQTSKTLNATHGETAPNEFEPHSPAEEQNLNFSDRRPDFLDSETSVGIKPVRPVLLFLLTWRHCVLTTVCRHEASHE
jgi:hypothetical protein